MDFATTNSLACVRTTHDNQNQSQRYDTLLRAKDSLVLMEVPSAVDAEPTPGKRPRHRLNPNRQRSIERVWMASSVRFPGVSSAKPRVMTSLKCNSLGKVGLKRSQNSAKYSKKQPIGHESRVCTTQAPAGSQAPGASAGQRSSGSVRMQFESSAATSSLGQTPTQAATTPAQTTSICSGEGKEAMRQQESQTKKQGGAEYVISFRFICVLPRVGTSRSGGLLPRQTGRCTQCALVATPSALAGFSFISD